MFACIRKCSDGGSRERYIVDIDTPVGYGCQHLPLKYDVFLFGYVQLLAAEFYASLVEVLEITEKRGENLLRGEHPEKGQVQVQTDQI